MMIENPQENTKMKEVRPSRKRKVSSFSDSSISESEGPLTKVTKHADCPSPSSVKEFVMLGIQLRQLDTVLQSQYVARQSTPNASAKLTECCHQCGMVKNTALPSTCRETLPDDWITLETEKEQVLLCPACRWLCSHRRKKQDEFLRCIVGNGKSLLC